STRLKVLKLTLASVAAWRMERCSRVRFSRNNRPKSPTSIPAGAEGGGCSGEGDRVPRGISQSVSAKRRRFEGGAVGYDQPRPSESLVQRERLDPASGTREVVTDGSRDGALPECGPRGLHVHRAPLR